MPSTKEKLYHHWTGWPGAHCFHCGSEDPLEYGIGNSYFNPYTGKWDTEEHQKEYEHDVICRAPQECRTPEICPQCKSK